MPSKLDKAPLFITKLVSAKPCSGAIKIEFNAGGDEVFTRYLSRPYAKELAIALLQILAAEEPEPAPPIDDIDLVEDGDQIRFTLKRDGAVVMTGAVTKTVGELAHRWLTKLYDGPNVVRMKAGKRKGHG
jgi:hypothetical protein